MPKYEYTIGKELDLKKEQEQTLSTPRLKSNIILKLMYLTFDIFYGVKRTLPKIMVLEILARYPYWAWENGSYKRLSKLYSRAGGISEKRVTGLVHCIDLGRSSQDNEQAHLFLVADIVRQKKIKLGWFRYCFIPRLLAFQYYYITRIMFFLRPAWSFAMNAAFESHAEREYMLTAREHPEWDEEQVDSEYFQYYPRQKTLNDLLRRIALDERDHMYHSLEELERLAAFDYLNK